MEKITLQKYMNPITFEAEMFVNSLQTLSKTYKNVDAVLIKSLQKVLKAIDTIFDSDYSEILETETTKLVPCDDIIHIKRIYHCTRCKTDLGKSVENATLHVVDMCTSRGSRTAITGSKNISNDNKKSVPAVPKKKNRKINLSKKTRALLTPTDFDQFFADHIQIGTKLKCIPDYEIIENDLLSTIKPLFPNDSVKIYKFGSRMAGIGTRESDLDLFVDIGGVFNCFQNRADPCSVSKLIKVIDALSKHKKIWKCLNKVINARVPIIRVIHDNTAIECDINFSNSLGTLNTQFLDFIFTLQPIARLMCIFMKKWASRIRLTDISSYAIILMTIFYLQTENVLPPIERFQRNVNAEKAFTVGPWLGSFATLSLKQLNISLEETTQVNVMKFIRGFFQFYKRFNYSSNIICPYLGKSVKISELNSVMPERYLSYVKDSSENGLKTSKAIIVQDFIQLNHNVAQSLSQHGLADFIAYMAKSLEYMDDEIVLYNSEYYT